MHWLTEPEVWVGLGLILFFGLLYTLNVHGTAGKALDAKSGAIRSALAEAEQLRAEALAMLEELKARRAQAEKDAAAMLADARLEAQQLEADARVKLEEQVARRTDLADRRIALAETQAAAEVKAAAGELAAQLAETMLAARLRGEGSDPLVDRAVGQIAQRLQ